MSKNYSLIGLCILFFVSCSSVGLNYNESFREVRYFKRSIQEIYRKTVTLSDGTKWRSDRFIVTTNMSDAFFVLDDLGYGHAYINGTKYNIEVYDRSYTDGYRYSIGYLNDILNASDDVMELSDGSCWLLLSLDEIRFEEWAISSEAIINYDENTLINPRNAEIVKAKIIDCKDLTPIKGR